MDCVLQCNPAVLGNTAKGLGLMVQRLTLKYLTGLGFTTALIVDVIVVKPIMPRCQLMPEGCVWSRLCQWYVHLINRLRLITITLIGCSDTVRI